MYGALYLGETPLAGLPILTSSTPAVPTGLAGIVTDTTPV